MKYLLGAVFLLFVLTSCGFTNYVGLTLPSGEVLKLKVASSAIEKSTGLSGIPNMQDFDGMLFLFAKPEEANFWMKDMQFSLDILYLDENRDVLEIHADQQPCKNILECPSITSKTNQIKYVVELASGKAEEYGIEINNKLNW